MQQEKSTRSSIGMLLIHKHSMESKEEEQKFAWNYSLLSNDKEDIEFYALLEALKNSTAIEEFKIKRDLILSTLDN